MYTVQPFSIAKKFALSAVFGLTVLSLAACQPVQSGAVPTSVPAAATAEATAQATAEATAEATTEAAANGATVPVSGSAAGIDMPAEIPSGVVTFAYQLAEDAPGLPEFARLNEGVTVDQVIAAYQADQMSALSLVTLIGNSDNSADGQMTFDLQPGTYIGILTPQEGAPLTTTFTAGEPSGAAAPQADVNVHVEDLAFVLPDEIAAGPQTWQIENVGGQWHEMMIVKLSEGVSVDDLLTMLQSEDAMSGPPPFEMMAGLWPMGKGQRAWANFDLPAGEYTVICFVPDLMGDMAPHAAHGMVRTLVVK